MLHLAYLFDRSVHTLYTYSYGVLLVGDVDGVDERHAQVHAARAEPADAHIRQTAHLLQLTVHARH